MAITAQKTWTLELSVDELIALAKAYAEWYEMKLATGHLTLEELLTLHHLDQISQRFPEEDWFPEEVRA